MRKYFFTIILLSLCSISSFSRVNYGLEDDFISFRNDCKLFENSNNNSDKYYSGMVGSGKWFKMPHSHNCIVMAHLKVKAPVSRQDLIRDTEDYIKIFLNVNERLINEKGIKESEYEDYFSDNFLKGYYKLNPIVTISIPEIE